MHIFVTWIRNQKLYKLLLCALFGSYQGPHFCTNRLENLTSLPAAYDLYERASDSPSVMCYFQFARPETPKLQKGPKSTLGTIYFVRKASIASSEMYVWYIPHNDVFAYAA